MNAVDTKILLDSLDASEPAKRSIAQDLLRDLRTSFQRTILPWQVQCETTEIGGVKIVNSFARLAQIP